MNRIRVAAIGAALVAAMPTLAYAQAAPAPVELAGDVKVDRVVVENGTKKHVLAEPGVVLPGDTLLFTTTYRNTAKVAIKDFVVTNPLPEAVALAPEGADQLTVSVDGGKTFGKLAALRLTGADGTSRAAQAGDVTHIRWILPILAPGASGALSYHATVR